MLRQIHPAFFVLTLCGEEVSLELCPSFFGVWFFIPSATGAHKMPSYKDFCIFHIDLLRMPNKNTSCLLIIGAIFNLCEQGFNRLLGVSCAAHLLKVIFQVHSCDVAVGHEEVIQNFTSFAVRKTHHVVV
jgi:hypothetical protein